MREDPRQFGWGARPDDRDWVLRARPTTRTWRVWRLGVRLDQGPRPECVGYAAAHLMAASPMNQQLGPRGIYALAKYVDEWQGEDYEGTSCRAAMKVLASLELFAEYRRAPTATAVARHVLEHGPVLVGTDWYTGMLHTDAAGVMHPTGEGLGGHAYLVRGYNARTRLLRISNSYGREWGEMGDAWIALTDFAALLDAGGEAWVGM